MISVDRKGDGANLLADAATLSYRSDLCYKKLLNNEARLAQW